MQYKYYIKSSDAIISIIIFDIYLYNHIVIRKNNAANVCADCPNKKTAA